MSMVSPVRRVLLASVAAIALVLPAACGSRGPTVTIGYEDAPDPEMVAIAEGYFAKYMHAHVSFKYYDSGPAALASLASGALQFMTVLGNPPVATAISNGVPLQVVWAQDQYTTGEGLVVRKSKNIQSLADLKGKTVALAVGSTSSLELATAEQQAGIAADKIQVENMAPPAMVAAWQRGDIDAALVWVPFFSQMLGNGGQALFYDSTLAAQAPIFNLAVVNTKFATQHPDLVQGFIRAEQAGVDLYRQNPAKAYQDMAKIGGISAADAQSQAQGLKFLSVQDQLGGDGLGAPGQAGGALVTTSLSAAGAWLKASERVTSVPADFSTYVNPSYAAAVAQSPQG